jgi:hypothetical protein
MKLYIVTMQTGPDFFKERVFADDFEGAVEAAELRFDAKCVNVRRAACHPGR